MYKFMKYASGYLKVFKTIISTPAPVAAFSADNRSPTGVDTVTFTDESTNTPTSWAWRYKVDAGSFVAFSTSQNPTLDLSVITPSLIGGQTLTIELTATNAGGSDVKTEVSYLTIQEL